MSNLSPAPGVPQTGTKAYVAAALSFIVAFGVYWIADKDPFTAKDMGEAAISGLVASGLIGGSTYKVKNKPTRR